MVSDELDEQLGLRGDDGVRDLPATEPVQEGHEPSRVHREHVDVVVSATDQRTQLTHRLTRGHC